MNAQDCSPWVTGNHIFGSLRNCQTGKFSFPPAIYERSSYCSLTSIWWCPCPPQPNVLPSSFGPCSDFFLTIKFWVFFKYSSLLLNVLVCKYFLPVCSLCFHTLNRLLSEQNFSLLLLKFNLWRGGRGGSVWRWWEGGSRGRGYTNT